jgi:guanylate kinase
VKALLESTPNLEVSVSHTTRDIRPGETDGINYHFVDGSEFESIRDANGFFEWAQVFGNFYGTSSHAIQERLAEGIDIVLEMTGKALDKSKLCRHCRSFLCYHHPPGPRESFNSIGTGYDGLYEGECRPLAMKWLTIDEAILVLNDDFDTALVISIHRRAQGSHRASGN